MKQLTMGLLLALLALPMSAAQAAVDAAKAQEVGNKNACFGCHAVDRKLVGPAYKDVAAKYKDDPRAFATLAKKVRTGGSGVWGPIPQPPSPAISEADLKIMLDWILAGAPAATPTAAPAPAPTK